MRSASVPGLASQLLPIPPTLSISGTGIAIPSTSVARLLTTLTSASNSVTASEESNAPTAEPRVNLGSIIEASEDLDAILQKISIESSRSSMLTFSVIVDFYAAWCGPCKQLSPILEKEVSLLKKSIMIKVDIDKFPAVAEKYGITSLPTVKAFKDGKMIGEFVGSRNKAFVEKFVKDH